MPSCAMWLQENEVEGLRAKLEAARKVAEGARLREDEARGQSRQHAERARGSASRVEELEEELSVLRSVLHVILIKCCLLLMPSMRFLL